ncbi:g5207 [Coccomyxa elongata]
MGEKFGRGKEPSRRRRTTEERSGQLDWSQLEPLEEGRAGDLPNDDRALFGDFASQLLEVAERLAPPQALQQPSQQLRLRGAGHQPTQNEPSQHLDSPGAGQHRQGAHSRFTGRSRSSSGTSSLQERHRYAAEAPLDAGEAHGEAGPSETLQQPSESSGSPQQAPKKRGKKKLPVPDLEAIKDPDERRRQRRLVKNRNTAAASRERKQREMDELNTRMDKLDQENAHLRQLLEHRDLEIGHLQQEIVGTSGAAGDLGGPAAGPSWGTSSGVDHLGSMDDRSPQQLGGSPSLADAAAARASLTASGVAAASMSGFVRGVDGQYLRLRLRQTPLLDAAEHETQPSAVRAESDRARGGMQHPERGDRSPGGSV